MHLFVYGVLREGLGDWPFLAEIGPGRAATTAGAIHAIPDPAGWYPALVPGEGIVVGALRECGKVDLAAVDAFEGPDYARRAVPVLVGGETIIADAYVWVAPLPPGALRIDHGDFARWLTETGRSPLSSR